MKKFITLILSSYFLFAFQDPSQAVVSFKAGTILQKTTTGNQAFTGVGFQPSTLILFGNQLTTDGSAADADMSFGIVNTSTDRRTQGFTANDAGTSQVAAITRGTTACYRLLSNGSTTVVAVADFVSFDADGFTLNFTTTDGTARRIGYIAIGGNSITNVDVGSFQLNTVTGNQSITSPAFQPDFAMFFTHINNTTEAGTSGAVDANGGIGFAASSTERAFTGYAINGGAAEMDNDRSQLSNKCIANGLLNYDADFVSFDTNGFTINITTAPAGAYWVHYLVIKGGTWDVGVFNQNTSTGNQSVTGLSEQPSGIILTSFDNVTSSVTVDNQRLSMGAGNSSSSRVCNWAGSRGEAAGDSINDQDHDTASVLKMLTEAGAGSPTLNTEADLVSLDTSGFTINNVTVDATSREIVYVAVGLPAAGGTRRIWLTE